GEVLPHRRDRLRRRHRSLQPAEARPDRDGTDVGEGPLRHRGDDRLVDRLPLLDVPRREVEHACEGGRGLLRRQRGGAADRGGLPLVLALRAGIHLRVRGQRLRQRRGGAAGQRVPLPHVPARDLSPAAGHAAHPAARGRRGRGRGLGRTTARGPLARPTRPAPHPFSRSSGISSSSAVTPPWWPSSDSAAAESVSESTIPNPGSPMTTRTPIRGTILPRTAPKSPARTAPARTST